MFKVFVNDGTQEIPSDDIFYVVAGNGLFLRKKLGILEALVPVKNIPHLDHVKTYAFLDIPKIPKDDFSRVVSFFRKVYEEHRSEAIALLYFNDNTKKYRIQIPFQEVSGASVDYEKTSPFKGFNLICTIHSHAGFGAFHSGVDDADEKYFDGLHITVGDLSKELLTISSSIVVNGKRFMVLHSDYIEGVELVEYSNYFPNMFRPSFEEKDGERIYKTYVKSQKGFFVADVPFEPMWMEFVTKKALKVTSYVVWSPDRSGVQLPGQSHLPRGSWLPYWSGAR